MLKSKKLPHTSTLKQSLEEIYVLWAVSSEGGLLWTRPAAACFKSGNVGWLRRCNEDELKSAEDFLVKPSGLNVLEYSCFLDFVKAM